jgi:hypothetical protein
MTSKSLLMAGLGKVADNKRYIVWFWLLNLTLAEFGTAAFRRSSHAILDNTLLAQRLVRGFDSSVFGELLSKPEFGSLNSMALPALYFAFTFFLATALFLPGIFSGYASNYRLPRSEFFRVCGRNLWRFIRIMIIAGIVMGIVAGLLFAANDTLGKKAGDSTNEKLPFELQMSGLIVMFLIMTTLRVWFDLAEADTVLDDQRAVRQSIAAAFRHTIRSFARLLTSYVAVTIVAATLLVGGLWIWMKFVPAESVFGAFVIAQITLFLLLIPRFWQRAIAVSYWQQRMLAPMVAVHPIEPAPLPVTTTPIAPVPDSAPVVSSPAIPPSEMPKS